MTGLFVAMTIHSRIPPPNWLRAFEVAARHLSFTQAAQELHVTQSAISQQVRLLENHLQEQLFQRHRRGLDLTDAGNAYLQVIHKSFEEIRRGTDEIFGAKSPSRITLKCNVSFSTLWLSSRFFDFSQQYPDIDLRITNAVWWDRSDQEGVDLEIRYGNGHWPGMSTISLLEETLSPVATSSYLKSNKIKKPEDLTACKLLHTLGHEKGWPDWFVYAGLERDKVATGLQFDTSTLTFEMARYGLGIALGLKSLRTGLLNRGDLVQPFDIEVPTQESFFLVLPEHSSKKPHVNIFVDWLLDQMKNFE